MENPYKIKKFHERVSQPVQYSVNDNSVVLTQQGLSLSPSEMYSKVMNGQLHSAMVNVRLENDNGDLDWNKPEEIELAAVHQYVQYEKQKVIDKVQEYNDSIDKMNKDTSISE